MQPFGKFISRHRRNRALGRGSSVPLEGTAEGKEGVRPRLGPEVCDLYGYPLGLLPEVICL